MNKTKIFAMLVMFAGLVAADDYGINDTIVAIFTLVKNIVTGLSSMGELIGIMMGATVVLIALLAVVGAVFGILRKFGVKMGR